MQLVITHQATQQLDEIYFYSKQHWGKNRAEKYLDSMQNTLDLLTRYPHLLRKRDSQSVLHFYSSESHHLFFAVTSQIIYLIGVYHSAMLLEEIIEYLEKTILQDLSAKDAEIQKLTLL